MASSYQFPLSDQQDYKARIKFRAYKEYTNTLSDIGMVSAFTIKDIVTGDESLADKASNFLTGTVNTVNTFFEDIQAKHNQLTGDIYRSPNTLSGPERKDLGSVSLFLPQAISIADAVEYGNVSLGVMGAGAAAAMREGGGRMYDAAVRAGAQVMGDVESLTDLMMGEASTGSQLAALRILKGASGELSGAIETEAGIAINPNRRSNLTGVGIRRFTFAFKLIPNSYEESQEIKNIIKFFRREMYPTKIGTISATSGTSVALGYPSKFNIEMSYDGKKVATGLLPCFLEGFSATYNPSGMAFHTGGDFQEYDIQMSFLEERPLTREDVEND